MKKIVLFTLILGAISFLFSFQGAWNVRTPELFGEGRLYSFQIGNRMFGVIRAWGVWTIRGQVTEGRVNCRINQILGEPINDAQGNIPCHMVLKSDSRFNGWIDFRGQLRPFCGAKDKTKIPYKCKCLSE